MKTVIAKNDGFPGWYAARQEGNYENTHIAWYWVGSDPDEQPDTSDVALGTPVWAYSESDLNSGI